MDSAYSTTTTVLPGNRIEFSSPNLKVGDRVEVVVTPAAPVSIADKSGPSIFEIIAALKGHRLFESAEEVDRYINEERDSWDR